MRKAVEILKRTKEGREALLEIIEKYGGFTSMPHENPIEQARLVARRGVATDVIQSLLTDKLNAFTLMMDERHVRLNANRAKEKDDDDSN